jgi:integrase
MPPSTRPRSDGKAIVVALNSKLRRSFPYCYAELSRHGKVVLYFRRAKGERKIRIHSEPFSSEFHMDYASARNGRFDAIRGHTANSVRAESRPKAPVPHTWRWLCEKYFAAREFHALGSTTRRVRRQILEGTYDEPIAPGKSETFGDCPLSHFRAKAIKVLRDRKIRREQRTVLHENGVAERQEILVNIEAANSRVRAIRAVLNFGKEEFTNFVERNWARDVSLLASGSDGHHTWSIEEIEQFERHFPVGTKARLALALLLYGGQRRGDTVRLGEQMRRDGMLVFTQEKNRSRRPVKAYVPIIAELQRILNASPTGDLVYLVSGRGAPFTKESFGNWFRDRCRKAGLEGCTPHGLRKACVVRMIELDCSPFEIMALTGHRTMKEVERYGREYLRERAALNVFEKWLNKHAATAQDAEAKVKSLGS